MARLSGSQMRLVWLWLTLSALGKRPELRTLNHRIELQKLVYLAQAVTRVSAYHFNPYIRGPYSPTLTRDLYGLLEPGRIDEAQELAAAYSLTPETLQELKIAEDIASERHDLSYIEWLELVASIHYKHEDTGGGFDDSWNAVKQWKAGIFDEQKAHAAWSSLEQHGLVST